MPVSTAKPFARQLTVTRTVKGPAEPATDGISPSMVVPYAPVAQATGLTVRFRPGGAGTGR
jgi:hypothetical protein